jgi:cell shape-determining protein MreC
MTAAPENAAATNAAPAVVPDQSGAMTGLQLKAGPVGPDLSTVSREELEARVKSLTQDLASANAEAESFREQWQDLKLRDEALGVEALTVDDQKLEDRLVATMSELYRSEMRRRESLQLMTKLLDTTQKLIATAPKEDPQVRADYEVASRAAKDYVAGRDASTIPLGDSLDDGRIADLNPELNAVVINLGKSQGVKEGMPFLVYQDNVEIGTVKVVLARDLVSAAVVESVKPNSVLKVGDRASVDARP